jgi:hypothetical protein
VPRPSSNPRSRFEIINDGRVVVVCWGSRNPATASRVDVEIINGIGRASLVTLPHSSRRSWVYCEPGGGYSEVTPGMRAVIARVLPDLA